MKKASIALAVLLVAGCAPTADNATPEDAMTLLALQAGYGVSGVPYYDGARWASNNLVMGCSGRITLVSNTTDENEKPTSFTVITAAGLTMSEAFPAVDARGLTADNLLKLPGVKERMACSS